MGLFSRKNSSKGHESGSGLNGDTRPSPHGSGNGNGSVKSPFNMKRVNSNPAQNASLPNVPLPKAPDPNLDPAGYLRSIYAVRERSKLVMGEGEEEPTAALHSRYVQIRRYRKVRRVDH